MMLEAKLEVMSERSLKELLGRWGKTCGIRSLLPLAAAMVGTWSATG